MYTRAQKCDEVPTPHRCGLSTAPQQQQRVHFWEAPSEGTRRRVHDSCRWPRLEVDVHVHVDVGAVDVGVVVVEVGVVVVRVAIHQVGARVDVARHAAVQPALQRVLVACERARDEPLELVHQVAHHQQPRTLLAKLHRHPNVSVWREMFTLHSSFLLLLHAAVVIMKYSAFVYVLCCR
eukprot:1175592-Prorocentrum_minimum.AAC.1